MHVYESSQSAGVFPESFELSGLVRQLGSEGFEHELSDTLSSTFHCKHMTAFSFSEHMPPRLIKLVASNSVRAAQHAAERYISDYWKVDPSNIFNHRQIDAGTYAVLLEDSQIADDSFRRDCYVETGITQRLSVISRSPSECLKISFHKSPEDGLFGQESIDKFLKYGDLLASLLMRHEEIVAVRRDHNNPERLEGTLARQCPELTDRERRVCSLIAVGLSSEAIALTLGVSINTVLTFRRRAYARLRISTQNELLRLLFQAQLN